MKKIIFGKPDIRQEDIDRVTDVLRSGWLGTGPLTKEFELEFARYKGVDDSLMLNSCTSALHLALLASNLEPGSEVITTAMTFVSTVSTIIHAGHRPVLVDCDDFGLIDPIKIEEAITNKTKAIVVVHYAGMPCEMEKIISICKKHNLILIEDCAHAIETKYRGKHVGTFGKFACFSFYSTKNIGIGEGGALIAKTKEDLDRCRVLSLHGMSRDAWKRFSGEGYKHYDVDEPGYKYNMMDIQSALGINQLNRIEEIIVKRKEVWDFYDKHIINSNIIKPDISNIDKTSRHALHLYILQVKEAHLRDQLLDFLNKNNIGCGVHYRSITQLKYYSTYTNNCSNAERIGNRCLSIPIGSNISLEEMNYIVQKINQWHN